MIWVLTERLENDGELRPENCDVTEAGCGALTCWLITMVTMPLELMRGVIDSVSALPPGVVLEGAGDCVWDTTRKVFWMGYGQRSDLAASEVVADVFGVETVALELVELLA